VILNVIAIGVSVSMSVSVPVSISVGIPIRMPISIAVLDTSVRGQLRPRSWNLGIMRFLKISCILWNGQLMSVIYRNDKPTSSLVMARPAA